MGSGHLLLLIGASCSFDRSTCHLMETYLHLSYHTISSGTLLSSSPFTYSSASNPWNCSSMEPLQQLSIDSFSYSWLINIKPSFDYLDDDLRFSLDTQDAGSFIEMDPNSISMRWKADSIDFDFSLPSSHSPALVHADQIFSNGLLLPLHLINPPKSELAANSSMNSGLMTSLSIDSSKSLLSGSSRFGSRYFYAATVPSGAISLNSSSLFSPVQGVPASSCSSSRGNNGKLHFLGGCTKSPKKLFQRYSSLLMPLYKKFKCLKSIWRAAGYRVSSTRSCMESIGASPRTSDVQSSFECCHGRRTFDMGSENVIHDAILHCKNSIGESLRRVAS